MTRLTDEQRRAIAEQPNPGSASPEYGRWWRARRTLGLPTEPEGLTKDYKKYIREYMKKRRAAGLI